MYVYRDGVFRRKMPGVKNHKCYLISIEPHKFVVPNVLSDEHHINTDMDTDNMDDRSIRYHRRGIGNAEINLRA